MPNWRSSAAPGYRRDTGITLYANVEQESFRSTFHLPSPEEQAGQLDAAEMRRAFVAAPGHVLVSADYSQIELRLLAHMSGDPVLIDAFRPEFPNRLKGSKEERAGFGVIEGIQPPSAKMGGAVPTHPTPRAPLLPTAT